MEKSLFVIFSALLATLTNASLCPKKNKEKKIHKEVLRWLVSSGVDPNITELVLGYAIPFHVAQIQQVELLKRKKYTGCRRLSIPKMVALGHSEVALVKGDAVHVEKFGEGPKGIQLKREGATPTAINYHGADTDHLVIAYSDGKVVGYDGKVVDFEVDTGKALNVITTSKNVLYGASEDGIRSWNIKENTLLGFHPLSETADSLHVQGKTIFVHTSQFNHYVLEEDTDELRLLDIGCRTISYGTELGERLCFGTRKEVLYYPSIKAQIHSWKLQRADILGAKLVPHEKAAMIILRDMIEIVGTEDRQPLHISTFKDNLFSPRAGDAEVTKSEGNGGVMVSEDGVESNGIALYKVLDRSKVIKDVIGKKSPLCVIL